MATPIPSTPVNAKPGERLHYLYPWPENLQCNDWHSYRREKGKTSWTSQGEGKCFNGQFLENPFEWTPTIPNEKGEWDLRLELTRNGEVVSSVEIHVKTTKPRLPESKDKTLGIAATMIILMSCATGAFLGGLAFGPLGAVAGFGFGGVVGVVIDIVFWIFK